MLHGTIFNDDFQRNNVTQKSWEFFVHNVAQRECYTERFC